MMVGGNSETKSIDDAPFSILADLYTSLRSVRITKKIRQAPRSRADHTSDRRNILTAAWLRLAEKTGHDIHQWVSKNAERKFVPAQVFPPEQSFKLLSLLVPSLDSSHAYLGMKETKLADAFIRALDLVPQADDAQWLKHFKEKEYRPQRWKQDADIVDGNLPTVLKAILHDRCPMVSSLTVGMIWQALELLTQASRGRTGRIGRFQAREETSRASDLRDSSSHVGMRRELDEKRNSALRILIAHGTAREVSEVARVILKDLDIRLSEELFFNWFHPGAKQHYIQIHDIKKLLTDCFDPTFEIGEAAVQVGQYASVMLTMRPSRKRLNVICENLRGVGDSKESTELESSKTTTTTTKKPTYFIMEPKLDGERLQLHKRKREFQDAVAGDYEIKTFSRRGNDSSAMYAGALTDVILAGVKAEEIILDGEIMIWDELRASWVRFEDVREVATAIAKQQVPEGSAYILKYMVFDVLYVFQKTSKTETRRKEGSMVIRLPLYKRRILLEKLVQNFEAPYGPGVKARIEVVRKETARDEQQLIQALQRYETLGYEGVIAKSPDMPYILAERSLDISIKLKPDYFDGGIQDLDVLILGAKYSGSTGHRKQRAGQLSSFLIGVRAEEVDTAQTRGNHEEFSDRMKHSKWIPVGSIGTGYSDKDLSELQNRFAGLWKEFSPHDLPPHFKRREYAANMFTDVAKWIQPWQSVVVTVRAYELNRRFYALRFPRVQRINWEKPFYGVATFTELLDLDENKIPVVVRPDEQDVDEVSSLPQKRRKTQTDFDEENALKHVMEEGHVITGGKTSRKLIDSAIGADVSAITPLSDAFSDLTFWIIASDARSKERLEVTVHKLGGKFTQNLTSAVDYVVCTSAHHAKVKMLREALSTSMNTIKSYSIVLRDWIEECYEEKSYILPRLEFVVHASRSLESQLFKNTDRYGDPWFHDTTAESLRKSLEKVKKWTEDNGRPTMNVDPSAEREIRETVETSLEKSGNVFSDMMLYVPPTSVQMIGSVALVRALGGQKVEQASDEVTHVLIHSSQVAEWKQKNPTRARLITEEWVQKHAKMDNM